MDPKKRFRPSHDRDDLDRDGPSSGVDQVNPHHVERSSGDPPTQQGGHPEDVRPAVANDRRDRQQDGHRQPGIDLNDPKEVRRRGNKLRDREGGR